MRKKVGRNAGFTLIELLIVILVLSILMAVALPLYLAAVDDSKLKSCRANMQTIGGAEQAYKTAGPSHVFTTNLADLAPNLGATPTCPSGGTYRVTISNGTRRGRRNLRNVPAGGIVIDCSATGHDRFAPGVDGQ